MLEDTRGVQSGVLVNSLPKSGTHLLEKALMILGVRNWETSRPLARRGTDRLGLTPPPFLEHLSAVTWSKAHLRAPRYTPDSSYQIPVGVFSPCFLNERTMSNWLSRRAPASFIKAHIPYHSNSARLLDKNQIRSITILRDPRAVAASMIPYVLNARQWKHFLQTFFETLNKEERVDFVIDGGFADPPGITVLSLADAFSSILDWEEHPGTLFVRFEDLVGPRGGGSSEALESTFNRIASHLSIAVTPEIRARMEEVFDPSSPTFRGGRVDGWRDRLTLGQAAKIETSFGPDLLERAGYSL